MEIKCNSSFSIRLLFLFFPRTTWKKLLLVEGVWSLGGEAGFVLATQDPVRQRELDLGVLQEESEEVMFSFRQCGCNQTYFKSAVKLFNRLSPVSEPPSLKMEAWNLEEESGFLSGGFLNWSWQTWRQSRERPATQQRPQRGHKTSNGVPTHVELLDRGSATLVGGDDLHLHDLDGVGASAVASSHVTIWRTKGRWQFNTTLSIQQL